MAEGFACALCGRSWRTRAERLQCCSAHPAFTSASEGDPTLQTDGGTANVLVETARQPHAYGPGCDGVEITVAGTAATTPIELERATLPADDGVPRLVGEALLAVADPEGEDA